jgi:alcohol dehydrogenase class IV
LDAVEALTKRLGIPPTLSTLREEDIPALAQAACREAEANYPVPVYLSQADCEGLIRLLLPDQSAAKPVTRRRAPAKSVRTLA